MRPLWQHQVSAIRKAEAVHSLGLFYEQGTGKTRTTIEILRRRFHANHRLLKTFIVAPMIVCDNWKREFAMYSKINAKDIIVLDGPQKDRVKEFLRAVGDNCAKPRVIVTNYHGLLMNDLYALLLRWAPEALVVDESQRAKNPKSSMAKRLVPIADAAQHKYILTGTPVLNSPMDLWMQYRILDGGRTFGKNFFAFRGQYFEDKNSYRAGKQGYFPKWEVRSGSLEVFQQKISSTAVRVKKSECLDLPDLVRQEVLVKLSPKQARMCEEMRKEFIAFVEELQIAATKALRMQQIVSGYAPTEQDGAVWFEDNPRIEALAELLEDITPSAKVIVWSVFKENYRMIREVCDTRGIKYAELHGDISNKQRIEEMDRFRADPECRVMIANQSAGGVGINLVEASYSIYYSKGFSLEQDLQSEARNHRSGSEMHDKITRIDLVSPGTVDEVVNKALAMKQNVADALLTWKGNL
jgi:SNF2 family DNA or RNA helicase